MLSRPDVYLLRHGESRWNAAGRLQGQTAHVPLTARGRLQASHAGEQVARSAAVLVLSSDLRRAVESARPVATRLRVPLRLDGALREQALGVYEGRLAAEVRAETGPCVWADPEWRPPGGESLRDVHARVSETFDRLRDARLDGPVVVVTHGDTARVAVAVLRGLGPRDVPCQVPANGEVIKVTFGETGP